MKYFDRDDMTPKVLEYCSLYHEDLPAAMQVFGEMHDTLTKVIDGVINTHKFYRFGEREDLVNVALMALMGKSGLCKFNPSYTKYTGKQENLLFSFVSLIAKQSIFFHTLKDSERRKREGTPIDSFPIAAEAGDPEDFIYTGDALLLNSSKFIQPMFSRTPYKKLYNYFLQHIKINGVFHRKLFIADMLKTIGTDYDAFEYFNTSLAPTVNKQKALRCVRNFIKSYKSHLKQYLLESEQTT